MMWEWTAQVIYCVCSSTQSILQLFFFLIAPSNDTCTTNGDVRLVGGRNQYEGRVEVCYNRQWGTVCGRHSWDTTDAGVACRQLGHSALGNFLLWELRHCTQRMLIHTVIALIKTSIVAGATPYSYSYFGRGNGSIYLYSLHCRGSESRLIDCSHYGIGFHQHCRHSHDAGLRCKRKATILHHHYKRKFTEECNNIM